MELYITLIENFAGTSASEAMRAAEQTQGSVDRRLRALIDAWFAVLESDKIRWRVLNHATSSEPKIAEALERIRSMQIANDMHLIAMFAPGLPIAEVRPIAEAMRASLIAIGQWWIDNPTEPRTVPVAAMVRICRGIARTAPKSATR